MELEHTQSLADRFLMRTYGRLPVAFERGEGVYLYDTKGERYLDLLAGIAVCILGHAHPRVTLALSTQAAKLLHVSNLYYIPQQAQLAERLCENSCFDKAFFCNSGAEANEAALKLARKYAKMKGYEDRYEVITAWQSFHGRTLTTITATGQPKYQKWFTPLPQGFKYVVLNDIDELRNAITEHTCAIMLEPIQGESGVHPATREYLQAARELANEHDFLLIFDEVQTGMGRTGEFFAHQLYGVEPDVATLAKGLANGVPIGACLAKDSAAVFEPGDHASTFGGNPLASAAALATLDELLRGGVMERARKVGAYFKRKLEELVDEFDIVKEVRGEGLMLGVELHQELAGEVNRRLFEHKILANSIADQTLRFLPPLILENEHVDYAVDVLRKVLKSYV